MYYLILIFNNLVNKIQLDTYKLNDFINIYDISIYIFYINYFIYTSRICINHFIIPHSINLKIFIMYTN